MKGFGGQGRGVSYTQWSCQGGELRSPRTMILMFHFETAARVCNRHLVRFLTRREWRVEVVVGVVDVEPQRRFYKPTRVPGHDVESPVMSTFGSFFFFSRDSSSSSSSPE